MEETIRSLLARLNACTPDEFVSGANLIDHLKEDITLGAGKGRLVWNEGKKPFKVLVSASDTENERLLTFVHEIFHIPFILRSIFCEGGDEKHLYVILEEGIDSAAELFIAQHSELVKEYYSRLLKPS
jgi:hypothetical protein